MRKNFVLSLLTGVLLSFAFPPFRIGIMAYWALVPFFYLLKNKGAKESFWWGFLTGLFITLSSINITIFSTLRGLASVIILNSSYVALYAMVHTLFAARLGEKVFFMVPFLWTGLEYLKTTAGIGLTWASLGYTHTQYLYLIENATSLNLFGIAFWVVLINVLIYLTLNSLGRRRKVAYLLVSIIVLFWIPWYLSKLTLPEEQEFEQWGEVAYIR